MSTWQGGHASQPHYGDDDARKKKIIWAVVITLLVGGIIAGCAIASSSGNQSPDDFIERTYTRAYDLDEANIDAFTSTKSPSTVAGEIAGQSKPIDQRTASDGSIWLQYSDDIVGIFPYNGGGSRIMADDYERVHSHYHSYVGIWWVSTPPGGSGWRGGGSGSGK